MKRANYVRLNWTAAACSRIPVAACPRIPFWLLIKRRECDAGSSLPWQPTYGFPLQPNHRFLFVFLIKEEKVVYNKRKKQNNPPWLVSPLGATPIEGLATHPVSRGPTSRKSLHSAPVRPMEMESWYHHWEPLRLKALRRTPSPEDPLLGRISTRRL